MAVHNLSAEYFIRNLDAREMPRYSYEEAGCYIGLPKSTVRAWFAGTTYGSHPNIKQFNPILVPASPGLLSFYDITSAHILMAFKARQVRPDDIRFIVESLNREYPLSRYPLLGKNFFLFGKDVVIKKLGTRLNLTRARQLGIKQVMDRFLLRVEVDAHDMPIRLTPLRTTNFVRGKGFIVIDPTLASGRPVVKGTGVAAEVISRRNKSGESIASLARDYRMSPRAIKEAITYFCPIAA